MNCSFGDVGASGTKTVHISSPTTSATCGTVSNSATAAATNEANTTNNTGSDSITVECPDLSVTKTKDASPVSSGDTIGFTIVASNAGPGIARSVTLSDTLPTNAGTNWTVGGADGGACTITTGGLSCSFGDVGASGTKTVHISSPTTSATCGTVSNSATAAATNEANTANNSGSDSITVECPDLSVTKTKDASPVSSGDTVGFTIVVSNAGPGIARSVTLSDTLPTNAGTSWSVGGADGGACMITGGVLNCSFNDVAAGVSKTVHISSPTTSATCGTVSNTATAAATNEANTANNSSSDQITVNCPDISVQKTADAATVNAGDQIGFTVTLSNIGAGTAYGVSFTDTLPAGLTWTINPSSAGWSITGNSLMYSPTTLAAGSSSSVHVKATTSSANCGTVSNTASASASNEKSANTSNNSATATVTVNCPDLTVSKTADAASVSATDPIGFTITVNNGGAGTANNVMLTDTLPTNAGLSWTINGGTGAGSCTINTGVLSCNFGTMASGGSKTVHISSPTTSATCGTVSNSASASASNEANTGNNSGLGSIIVNCTDVAVSKLADATPVNGGSPIGFKITVSNTGLGVAKSVMLTDTLPTNPGLSWMIDPNPVYTDPGCTISSGVLSCSYTTLASGGSKKVHITSTTTTSTCGTVTNTASASANNEPSSKNGNNSSTATITMTDVTAPVITLNGQTITMWSPNHKYETVKVTDLVASVSDSCSTGLALTAVYISKVTSDEPENINSGDGNTLNDMVIANDCKSVDLRAERDGSKNGRVYTIYFKVKDAAGNVGTKTAIVTVPHSQGPKGTAIDDGPVYTVTNPLCP